MMDTQEIPIPTLVYTPPDKGLLHFNLRELWAYRELLFFLTWRDIKIRYTQTALGVTWAILQPLISMAIFSIIFGRLAKLPSGDVPYPVFAFTALLPWQLFAGALSRASTSLVANRNLITKVYFPRLIIPISAAGAGLLDFAISFIMLIILMLFYGITPTWAILWLPALTFLALVIAVAVSLWLSALNVQYRDVEHAIPFLIQAWMYASPVAYSTELIPEGIWQILYGLNPMAGVIQGFRWALLGTDPPGGLFIASVAVTLFLLVGGLVYFQKMEETFADIV